MRVMKNFLAVGCICLLLTMSACTSAQIVNTIEVSIQLISSILPIISANTGMTADQNAMVLTYLQESDTALDQVNTILQQGGSKAVIAVKITAALSGVVAATPNLTGLPASVASTIQQLAANLVSILQTYGSTPKLASGNDDKTFSVSSSDLKKLKACHNQFVANQVDIYILLNKKK